MPQADRRLLHTILARLMLRPVTGHLRIVHTVADSAQRTDH